jgi:hypothetical protein
MRKAVAVACLLLFHQINEAQAELWTRTVPAGQTTRVFVYKAWDRNCVSAFGVVKVSAKPQHGKLSNHIVDTAIPAAHRFGSSGQCSGQPTKGLAVFYTPGSGFHGTDTFTLDVSWAPSGKQASDTFVVTVQ